MGIGNDEFRSGNEPCFVISVAARIVKMHPQTLRYYERVGLIEPSRSRGRIRLYSQSDIDRLQLIQRLINDLGVNLAGVEVIMHMNEQMAQMERQLNEERRELERENEQLREALAKVLGRRPKARAGLEDDSK